MTKAIWGAIILALGLVLIVAPQRAAAQVTFYHEEAKENRIYVFYNLQSYGEWKSGGEMGKSITRIGYGPGGETVVFDSNEAINYYNYKHNLPIETFPAEKKPVMKVSWKDGKTTIDTDIAQLNISNRIQVRYTDSELLAAILPPGLSTGDRFGSFRLRRAKTKFDGWFYNKDLTYELQINFADVLNALEDANMQFDITRGKKALMIKGGQFKVPFGRQELTSSGNQQFVDRSAVSNLFARGRDLGVQVWGTPMNGKLDWRIGFFNGNGRNVVLNDNADFQIDGRVTFQPWGDVKYSESDFESTDKPLLAVAGQFEITEQSGVASGTASAFQRELEIYGFDAVFKYKGLFVFYDHYERNTKNVVSSSKVDSRGYNFQAGYFVIKQKLEIAGRYSEIDLNKDVSNDANKEYGVAVGYFYNKHNLKLQGDYRRLETQVSSTVFDEFRVQLQFIF